MIAQGTIRRGSRCSTAKAFLRPVRLRKNLHVAMNAQVTKVLIDDVKMQATGVEFVRYGKKYRISARREVIMSAGAINSPQSKYKRFQLKLVLCIRTHLAAGLVMHANIFLTFSKLNQQYSCYRALDREHTWNSMAFVF